MQSSVKIKGVTKWFGDAPILEKIYLSVNAGEFISILGPSGCGKSTLLRIVAGLESPTHGAVEIGDEDVTKKPVWKRQIGFVFQNFALWPHLSVLGNVAMGLELQGVRKEARRSRALDALRMVQLDAYADRTPAQLSGGQQQRVAIARAIVLGPKVLLLDEPLSALDKNLRQDMQVELKQLQRKLGITTIFVTHDQEEAMSLSDRVVVMNRGAIEQVDSPERIYQYPSSEYVARFVGETTFFEGKVIQAGSTHVLDTKEFGEIPLEQDHIAGFAGEAKAFVRPEWISIEERGAETGKHLLGTVEQVMFLGARKDYLVRINNSLVRVASNGATSSYQLGDAVALAFHARVIN